MWCSQCGGGSVCLRRLCRRTETRQDGPHTLQLCWRRTQRRGTRRRWLWRCYCARLSNQQYQSSSDSRTDRSLQTCSQFWILSSLFLCSSQICGLFLSTPPPSNSRRSERFYTAAATSRTCRGDRGTAAPPQPPSPSCCCRTLWGWCSLSLGPIQVHRNLKERKVHDTVKMHHGRVALMCKH